MNTTEENARSEEVREDVIVAYQEVMNKLKLMKTGQVEETSRDSEQEEYEVFHENLYQPPAHEERYADQNIIELAAKETAEGIAKDLMELKASIPKFLDDMKIKLLAEQEKFDLMKKANNEIAIELERTRQIKIAETTLTSLLMAYNERKSETERELSELKKRNHDEMVLMENDRISEQSEYVQKRDAMRKSDQELYENRKRELIAELEASYRKFEQECETRRAKLEAWEAEHEKWKKRHVTILAAEHELERLREVEVSLPQKLEAAIKKAENTVSEQLTRKYNYDLKVSEIAWSSEKNILCQKIETLQQQIEQYMALKELYS